MTKLSVNINKVATLRNARGGNVPDVVKFALDCERFGAQGITVHPRPDERHIRYKDVFDLKPVLTTEFNIEGNPVPRFVALVKAIKPAQVTLVPDAENVLTSNAGWDTVKNQAFLSETVAEFKSCGIRVSIFIDPVAEMIEMAARTGTDRVELYTEAYARQYPADCAKAIAPYLMAATDLMPDTTSHWRTSSISISRYPGSTKSLLATPSSATPSTWALRRPSTAICSVSVSNSNQ